MEAGIGGLTPEEVASFHEHGYLIVENAYLGDALWRVVREYELLIDSCAGALAARGLIQHLHEGEPFDERIAGLAEQAPDILDGLDISLPLTRQAAPEPRMHCSPAVFELIHNEALLGLMESLIGPAILSNPVQHIRAKPPRGRGVFDRYHAPWHQDAGVLLPEADNSFIVTVWIPLVDVPVEKGCMEVVPGSHKLGLLRHEPSEYGLKVAEKDLPDRESVALPVALGGLVLMHNLTLHRSLPNLTGRVRWTVDLRYQSPEQPTGRPFWPAFVVRNRADPERAYRDFDRWEQMWLAAHRSLEEADVSYNRWSAAGTPTGAAHQDGAGAR